MSETVIIVTLFYLVITFLLAMSENRAQKKAREESVRAAGWQARAEQVEKQLVRETTIYSLQIKTLQDVNDRLLAKQGVFKGQSDEELKKQDAELKEELERREKILKNGGAIYGE